MTITDLLAEDEGAIEQIASMLVESFSEHWPDAWPDMASALAEVHESFSEGRLSRVAFDDAGNAVGWIGGISGYDGLVWELHPLVVSPRHRESGIGRALVNDLESQVKARGGLTITLGSDDQDDQTTLSGVDLYKDLWKQIANIKNLKRHPYEFYMKLGYVITGVVPDANGRGKPDILMAKRIASDE